jgi:hypothetical protein
MVSPPLNLIVTQVAYRLEDSEQYEHQSQIDATKTALSIAELLKPLGASCYEISRKYLSAAVPAATSSEHHIQTEALNSLVFKSILSIALSFNQIY